MPTLLRPNTTQGACWEWTIRCRGRGERTYASTGRAEVRHGLGHGNAESERASRLRTNFHVACYFCCSSSTHHGILDYYPSHSLLPRALRPSLPPCPLARRPRLTRRVGASPRRRLPPRLSQHRQPAWRRRRPKQLQRMSCRSSGRTLGFSPYQNASGTTQNARHTLG